jgi:hypothetical protein
MVSKSYCVVRRNPPLRSGRDSVAIRAANQAARGIADGEPD